MGSIWRDTAPSNIARRSFAMAPRWRPKGGAFDIAQKLSHGCTLRKK
jgi:hypothetical protein